MEHVTLVSATEGCLVRILSFGFSVKEAGRLLGATRN